MSLEIVFVLFLAERPDQFVMLRCEREDPSILLIASVSVIVRICLIA